MKTKLFTFLIICLTLFACKKDDTDVQSSAQPTTPSVIFKCSLNGVEKNFPGAAVSVTVGHTLAAGDTTGLLIFNLLTSANIGSYYIHPWGGTGNPYGSYYAYGSYNAIDSAMVIISDTTGHKIKGTFYFKSGTTIGDNGVFENVPLP